MGAAVRRAKAPRRVEAYTWAAPRERDVDSEGRCACGSAHSEGARYYVSVIKEPSLGPDARGNVALVAGPFADHADALRWVDPARNLVLDRYNPDGRAHWYGYGTVAMASTYETPGRLNGELGVEG